MDKRTKIQREAVKCIRCWFMCLWKERSLQREKLSVQYALTVNAFYLQCSLPSYPHITQCANVRLIQVPTSRINVNVTLQPPVVVFLVILYWNFRTPVWIVQDLCCSKSPVINRTAALGLSSQGTRLLITMGMSQWRKPDCNRPSPNPSVRK